MSKTERVSTGVYLKSGSFWAVVRNKWIGPFPSKEQAMIKRDSLKAEQAPKPVGGPFAQFMRKVYYPLFMEKMRTNTIGQNKRAFEGNLIPYFADKKIGDIKMVDLLEYQQSETKRGCAASTVNSRMILLSAVFEAAIKLEYITINPVNKVDRLREAKKDRHVLTEVEIIDLTNSTNHHFSYLIALMGLAGARVGEALGFQWDDFDLGDRPTISFERTINTLRQEDGLKTEGSKAILPMVMDLRDILIEWKADCPSDKWLFQGALFPNENRRNTTRFRGPHAPSRWWVKLRPSLGLNHMRLYDFRHSFVTNVVTRCANIKTAQKLARHSSINTTLEIYAHVRPEQLEEIWTWTF